MPDINLSEDHINFAKNLCPNNDSNNPGQTDLRRAVSTAYYAVFHALARECANALVGDDESNRSKRAWVQVYRGLSHSDAKIACSRALGINFPEEIKEFADAFRQLQPARHEVDYNPIIELEKNDVINYINIAGDSIEGIKNVDKKHKVAFAAWVLFKKRSTATLLKKPKYRRKTKKKI